MLSLLSLLSLLKIHFTLILYSKAVGSVYNVYSFTFAHTVILGASCLENGIDMADDREDDREGDEEARASVFELLRRLTIAETRRANMGPPRPKAINCSTYTLGENFENFATHFRHSVKAAYDYKLPRDEDQLDEACIQWIATKLKPGPTLITYESLPTAKKISWKDTRDALTEAFSDETEKETFLADQASFRRGDKSLVQYKNELLRLMKVYLPNLQGVPEEFQRQATTRFIEGLDDDELKKLLRRHCKRERMTLEAAYLFTVDHESSELQTRIRDGDATAAFSKKTLGATADVRPKVLSRSSSSSSSSFQAMGAVEQPWQEENRGLPAKVKINEMKMQELTAKIEHTNDRVDILCKEVGQNAINTTKLEKRLDARLDRIEQLIVANGSNAGQQSFRNQPQNASFQHYRGQRNNQFHNQAARGASQSIRPSITGGPGYLLNNSQQRQFRAPAHNPAPTRPAGNDASNPPLGGSGGETAADPLAATAERCVDDENTEVKQSTGWFSPNMMINEVAGYEENDDNLSYGGDFYWQ